MKAVIILLVIIAVVVFACFGSYVSAKNQMVAKDQTVKSSWSEVDVQLERRADLIPNLVETVKGFTKEENSVFSEIANARAGMINAQLASCLRSFGFDHTRSLAEPPTARLYSHPSSR